MGFADIVGSVSSTTGAIVGTIASALALIFGIFALIPVNPFKEPELAAGIVLIVFTGVGITFCVVALICGGICACCLLPCKDCLNA